MNKSILVTIIAVLALILGGAAIWQVNNPPSIQEMGVSNLSSLHLSDLPEGTATPVFIANEESGGSANVAEIRVASTPVWSVSSAGVIAQTGGLDLNGAALTIGEDGGVTLDETADDVVALTMGAGAGTTSVLVGNLKVGDGSPTISQDGEDFYVQGQVEFDGELQSDGAIDANSTSDFADTATFSKGSGNAIVVSSGGAIDANGTSDFADTATFSKGSGNAIVVSSGGAIDANGNVDIAGSLSMTQVNSAGASANPFDWTGTLGAMDGGDTFVLFDINPTNADHSGGTATMLDIGGITGDNEATENAITIGSGYDFDLNATTSLDVGVDGVAVVTVKDPGAIDSNTTNEMVEIIGTTPVDTAQTNTHNFLTIDAAIGASSGGTNNVRGVQIDGVTGDAQVIETGINIDTGWDNALDVNGQPILIGADGGVTLDEVSDDNVTLGFGAGAGVLTIGTGNLIVGAGSPTVAQNGQDAFFSDQVEVDGELQVDGTVDINGATAVDGGDVTLGAAAGGGNAGAKNEFIGLPRIKLVGGGSGTNPAAQTIALVDDSPTGEFAPVDADVTEAEGSAGGIFKVGASSYAATFAGTAAEDDGFVDAGLGAAAAWDDMESFGAFVYITTTVASGDLQVVLTDDGGARKFSLPAVTANTWTWIEADISTGDLSAISDVAITLTANGATNLGAFTIYLDTAYVWDSADEEALGVAIVQDGILGVVNTETGAPLVEGTDYIVHYESGSDFIVYITDQSTADIIALVAY